MAIDLYSLEQAEEEIAQLRGQADRLSEVIGVSTGQPIQVTDPLTAIDPVNGGPETWHSLTGFATGFSVTGFAKYRKNVQGGVDVEIQNLAYNGTGNSADGAVILVAGNGFPAAYQPGAARRRPVSCNLLRQPVAGVFEAASLQVEADGSITCQGVANGATRIDAGFSYPLATT